MKPKKRVLFRIVKHSFQFAIVYLLVILVGLVPVNGSFVESEDGIEIFVQSGEFHSDLIIPIDHNVSDAAASIDWRTMFLPSHFQSDQSTKSHLAFGWGDRSFFIDTPSLKDLKARTAINALLLPSETVMHVTFQNRPIENSNIRSVKVSKGQYSKLVRHLVGSFAKDTAGEIQPIAGAAYSGGDAFYVANGSYHAFRTCNSWVGEGLRKTGVKVGWFTPMPKTVLLYLNDE